MKNAPLLVALFGALLMACVASSPVRRTALVPAATLPARVGEPLGAGQGRVVFEVGAVRLGELDPWLLDDFIATIGTPGVLVPRLHLGGSAYVGLGRFFELGARLQFTQEEWADANVIGVLPFPSRENVDLWTGGPGVRANFGIDEQGPMPVWISLIYELNYASVPQAVYVCENCGDLGLDVLPLYQLDRTERETFWLSNIAAQVGFYPADWTFVAFVIGGQSGITNTGFDIRADLEDSSLEKYFMGYAGLGADFLIDPLVLGTWFYLPFGGEAQIDFGFRASFQVGLTWGRPDPQPRPFK